MAIQYKRIVGRAIGGLIGTAVATVLITTCEGIYHFAATTSEDDNGQPLIVKNVTILGKSKEPYTYKNETRYHYHLKTDKGEFLDDASEFDDKPKDGTFYNQLDSGGVYNFHINRDKMLQTQTVLSLTTVSTAPSY